jgi:hypothetical protein
MSHKFNQKGQAFDVFKLLIAAVVAGAILLILLQVLNVLPPFQKKDPNNIASENVKSQINNLGSPITINDVTFSENAVVSAKTIAQKSGALSKEQVCLLVSDKVPNYVNFSNDSKDVIIYNGKSTQRTRLVILCDRADEIDETMSSYQYDSKYNLSTDDCEFDGTQTVCIVGVIPDT